MNTDIEQWKSTTWQIRPSLDVPDLDPEAVQIAVLDADPIERYRQAIAWDREKYRTALGAETDAAKRDMVKTVQMAGTWDLLFREVTGDQLHLLVPSHVRGNDGRVRMQIISSSGPGGRKWVATKVVYRGGKPVCWCVAVETVMGKESSVELKGGNTLDLQGMYERFMASN
jgi:hypothetical protein